MIRLIAQYSLLNAKEYYGTNQQTYSSFQEAQGIVDR